MADETTYIKENLKRPVVLTGMMGTGKSHLGAALARRLGTDFHDSDALVEARAGCTIAEIFARDGEAKFRQAEAGVMADLLENPKLCVVSTGGGAVLDLRTRDLIREKGVWVWLDVPVEALYERLKDKTDRPLLQAPDPKARLEDLLAERQPLYAQADIRLGIGDGESAEQSLTRLIKALFQHIKIASF